MKNIIIYGAPAAGKGTACESLVEKYNYNHISTGALFRSLGDDELSLKIKETISKGMLVDDETTTNLLKENLKKIDNDNPIILDGFPRNIYQAKLLEDFFDNFIVINLSVDEEVAKVRTLGRINCSKCGKIYNKFSKDMIPKNEGICDICGSELISRSDDNEESFKIRYNTYIKNCEEVFDYYKCQNKLYMVNSNNSAEETFNEIEEIINSL